MCKQRRFPCAGWTHHRNEFAFSDIQIDVAQNIEEFLLTQRISAFEIFKTDHKVTQRAMLGLDQPAWRGALATRWR